MKHVKEFLKSKAGIISLLAVATALILIGGIGGTRAALSVYSEQYNSRLKTSDIGVSLYENDVLTSERDYDPDAGDYSWIEKGSGALCQTLIGMDGEIDKELKIGKNYKEELKVANSGNIDIYVRVLLWKYWAETDEEGNITKKRTDLDPDLIELHFLEDGWIRAAGDDELSKECTVLYYTRPLAAGEETSLFTDFFRINDRVMNIVSETSTKDASGATVVTLTYEYDGMQFVIEAEADAVQTHNAQAAILSAWGREASFNGNEITAIK